MDKAEILIVVRDQSIAGADDVGCCQTNANSSQFDSGLPVLCSTKLLPLIECSTALKLELVSAV